MSEKVWLLTSGDGEDGNEWNLIGIYSTHALALAAQENYCRERVYPSADPGKTFSMRHEAAIEEWPLDQGIPE